MTDAAQDRLTLVVSPPETLLSLELWGDRGAVETRLGASLPTSGKSAEVGDCRLLWWEPGVWIARAPLDMKSRMEETWADKLGAEGAVTDMSGAFTRIRLCGRLWCDLLMIGGVFDAESPAFGPGSIAGTVIHHMPVRIDVISETEADVFTPPSYAEDLLHHWTRSAARLTAQTTT